MVPAHLCSTGRAPCNTVAAPASCRLFSYVPTSSACDRMCRDRPPFKPVAPQITRVDALPGPCQHAQGKFSDATICDRKLEASDRHLMSIAEPEELRLRATSQPGGVGHGSGLGGTHRRCIWHRRYRRACDRRLHGRLCLRLSRGSSHRGGGASEPADRGKGRAAQAAWPDESLVRSVRRGRIRARFRTKIDASKIRSPGVEGARSPRAGRALTKFSRPPRSGWPLEGLP